MAFMCFFPKLGSGHAERFFLGCHKTDAPPDFGCRYFGWSVADYGRIGKGWRGVSEPLIDADLADFAERWRSLALTGYRNIGISGVSRPEPFCVIC
jgi:hypothetical protein